MKKWLKSLVFSVLATTFIAWSAALVFYNHTVSYPMWYHPFAPNAAECTDPQIVQNKFNPNLVKVEIKDIPTSKGILKAWYFRALKNRTGKGALLVHGGGGDHNLLNPYANYLSEKGWDSLAVDLPNHGCSYNNGKGLLYGTAEDENFDRFYDLAQKYFKVEGIIATSMGSTIASTVAFEKKWPIKLFLENPMISFQRIVTDQKAYYLPSMIKPIFEWEIINLNSNLTSKPITEIKPAPDQKIMILYGTKDHLTPVEQSKELLSAWSPNVSLKIIDGAWHAQLMQHAPGKVESILDHFLLK